MFSHKTQTQITTPVRVVIPAYKAGDCINACLQNVLTACNYFTDIEVVVVAYDTIININFDHRLQIIEPGKPLNAGEARNLGALNSNNRIIVFIDADVLIDPESLPKLLQPIINGEADATVGNYATNLISNKFFQNYKKLYIHQAYAREGYITNEFWTAYAAISHKAFFTVGGFSEQFKFKGGEDTEIGVRLTARSFKIYAVANVFGNHLKEFTFGSLVSNDFVKGSRTVFLALNRKMSLQENRHAKKSDQVAVALACLIALFIIGGGILHWIWLFLPLLMAMYIGSRFNFLSACSKQGAWFFIRACSMAWLLDIVRAASIANGMAIYFLTKWFKHQKQSTIIPMPSVEPDVYANEETPFIHSRA